MKLLIEIDTDNSVFEEDLEGELKRILLGVANRIADLPWDGTASYLFDANGNKTGSAAFLHE